MSQVDVPVALGDLELTMDVVFLVDIALNFRTAVVADAVLIVETVSSKAVMRWLQVKLGLPKTMKMTYERKGLVKGRSSTGSANPPPPDDALERLKRENSHDAALYTWARERQERDLAAFAALFASVWALSISASSSWGAATASLRITDMLADSSMRAVNLSKAAVFSVWDFRALGLSSSQRPSRSPPDSPRS